MDSQVSMQIEAAALDRIMKALDQNQPARSVELSDEEAAAIRPLYLLTMKPMIYAANVAEDDLADLGAANKHVQTMRNKIAKDGCELIIVSAQVRRQTCSRLCILHDDSFGAKNGKVPLVQGVAAQTCMDQMVRVIFSQIFL